MACNCLLSGLVSLVLIFLGASPLPAQTGDLKSRSETPSTNDSPADLPEIAPANAPVNRDGFRDIRQLDPESETYSILDQAGISNGKTINGTDAKGTFALQQDGFRPAVKNSQPAQQPWATDEAAGKAPSLPPIATNGLRREPAGSRFGDQPTERSFGDQKLAWDQPPSAPKSRQIPNQSARDALLNQQPSTLPPSAESLRRAAQPSMSALGNELSSEQSGKAVFQNRGNGIGVPMGTPRTDNQVRPVKFQENANRSPLIPKRKTNTRVAKELLDRYAVDQAPDPLPGRPVRLKEMLEKTPQHLRRKMVHQYWETYYDWATLLKAANQLKWLGQVSPPRSQNERVLLNAARQAAENQVLSAEIQLGKSQSKLKQLMTAGPQDDLLPLPADRPIVRGYNTHYDYYDQRGQIPAEYKGFNTVLPKMRQLVANRAETVQTATSAVNQTRNAFASGAADLGTLLEGVRLWNDAEQILISSVVNYNQAIGDYSLRLFAQGKSPQQIANMLVVKQKAVATRAAPMHNANAPRMRFGSSPQQIPGGSRRFDLSPQGASKSPSANNREMRSTSAPGRGAQRNPLEKLPGANARAFGGAMSNTSPPVQQTPAGERTARTELFGRGNSFGPANNSSAIGSGNRNVGERKPATSKPSEDNSFGGFGK